MLFAFAKLGENYFGGPIAHLGYFRAEFVERRQWIEERGCADLVALYQFLPGPASSQTGFALGLMRGGYLGGLAAWAGFTAPSAILLVLFAYAAALRGVNTAVVGLLGTALYDPVWTSAVLRPADFAVALLGFVLLVVWRAPPVFVVALGAAGRIGFALMTI